MLTTEKGVVEEWLSEFKTLPETSLSEYAENLKDKSTLVSSLYKVIQEPQSDLLEPVCHQLFEFYRSGEKKLLLFTLQFLPELMWCYLTVSATWKRHSTGCIEALLLGVYNLPSSIGSMALTESALCQHGLSKVVYSGPHPQREMLTAQNRFEVLTFLLLCYNAALTYMPNVSLQSLCQICSRICICGYPRQHVRKYKGINIRIPISSEFMVQMLTGVYFAFYNGEWDMAEMALEDVLYRAQLELFPEPLLVANAIKTSLPAVAMQSSKEGKRCIQVEITPTSSRISRNAVTSMSIRGHRWKRHGNTDLTGQEELMEISEADEGFYSRAASSTSQAALSNTTATSKTSLGKNPRRSGGSRTGGKEKEASGESGREHSGRKQNPRALSENLELLSLKRLTLTTSQSLPKPGSHSLARTATTIFSKSFEQVSGSSGTHNPGTAGGGGTGTDANRFSACSLQEEKLIYISERAEPQVPVKHPPSQQRPPSISITLSAD
ncbi:hyccin isoform X2 [Phascolarctos cinereus]|uniref:Hyccin isoform X2 n=1 Tax=Phascolarctos cinereus TaxID=38626 RepID=A0A6P5KTE7_PHACI|nr:hyccin isoform X2 [Phascolarctos cinereus]